MKPLVVFPDAKLATLEVLRHRIPAEVDGVAVGTTDPRTQNPNAPSFPYVRVVGFDSTYGKYPVTQTSSVRLNVYDATPAKALRLAHVVHGILLAYEGGPEVRSFGAQSGPLPTTDPDTNAPVAFLTVSARLRPEPLE